MHITAIPVAFQPHNLVHRQPKLPQVTCFITRNIRASAAGSASVTAGHLIGQQCHTFNYAFWDLFFFRTIDMHNMQAHRPSPPHCQHRVSALSTHDLCKSVQSTEQTQIQQCTGCPGGRVIPRLHSCSAKHYVLYEQVL